MDRRFGVVGNSVAALVAARELAANGAHVELITPGARFGGIFAGHQLEGMYFENGTILLELTDYSSDPAASLATYDPLRRNDCGRFVDHVSRYLRKSGIELHATPTPLMSYRGSDYPDLILSNRLDALPLLPSMLTEAMRRELEAIVASGPSPLHARHKKNRPAGAWPSLEATSLANHGRTFHDTFIEPLCRKITGRRSSDVLAIHHRSLWLPLYYPETLLAALNGQPPSLPVTTFFYPSRGGLGALVAWLERSVRDDPRIRVTQGRVTAMRRTMSQFELTIGDETRIDVDALAWAGELAALLELADRNVEGTYAKAPITVVDLIVDRARVRKSTSSWFALDTNLAPFRITNLSACEGSETGPVRFIVEFGGAPAEAERIAIDAVVRLGIIDGADAVQASASRHYAEALLLPSAENMERFETERHAVGEAWPDIHLLGATAGFAATGVNDQVVQGLQLGSA